MKSWRIWKSRKLNFRSFPAFKRSLTAVWYKKETPQLAKSSWVIICMLPTWTYCLKSLSSCPWAPKLSSRIFLVPEPGSLTKRRWSKRSAIWSGSLTKDKSGEQTAMKSSLR